MEAIYKMNTLHKRVLVGNPGNSSWSAETRVLIGKTRRPTSSSLFNLMLRPLHLGFVLNISGQTCDKLCDMLIMACGFLTMDAYGACLPRSRVDSNPYGPPEPYQNCTIPGRLRFVIGESVRSLTTWKFALLVVGCVAFANYKQSISGRQSLEPY